MICRKQNRLNLSEYQSESKKYKYIPYDDNTYLDYEMKINNVNFIVSNSWCGFVSASVAPTYDYKNNKLQYTESNYQNVCVEKSSYNLFKKQGKTSYEVNGITHIINTKTSTKYFELFEETDHIVFVNSNK